MPFIYDKSRAKACRQCSNSDERGICKSGVSFDITTVTISSRSLNTYSCNGFQSKTGKPDKFSIYYQQSKRKNN